MLSGSVLSASSGIVTQQPTANTRPQSALGGGFTSVDNNHSAFEVGCLNRTNAYPGLVSGVAGVVAGGVVSLVALAPAVSAAAVTLPAAMVSVCFGKVVEGVIAGKTEQLSLDTVEKTVGRLKASWEGGIKDAIANLDLSSEDAGVKQKNAAVFASVLTLNNGLNLAAAHANKLTLPVVGNKDLAKEARAMLSDVRVARNGLQDIYNSRKEGTLNIAFPGGVVGTLERVGNPQAGVEAVIADLGNMEGCLGQIATMVDSGTPRSVSRTISNEEVRHQSSYYGALPELSTRV